GSALYLDGSHLIADAHQHINLHLIANTLRAHSHHHLVCPPAQRAGDPASLGAAAIAKGWLDDEELAVAVERQAVEVVAELVGWRDGSFRFTEGGVREQPPARHRLDALRLLMDVLAEREDADVGVDPDAVLARVGDPTSQGLPPEAWDVLALVDGHRSARAIAAETDLSEARALALLGLLVEAGVIAPAPDAVAPADVLVVAPGAAEGRLLRLALLRAGVRPTLVADVATADARFDALRPSAVVADVASDPWRWLRGLRRRREGAHVPVLVVGARPAGALTAWRRPAADVLAKPFRELELQAWVTASIGRRVR
ncbi:MAG: hypothetical protein P1P87_14505, partial [Trueperaceae bacterium]|nr:hypothetical protein [Trueperaceae bacterium]